MNFVFPFCVILRIFCALHGRIDRLKVPRAISPCGRNLAAREENVLVREKHLESCFSLRLPLQELFDNFVFF